MWKAVGVSGVVVLWALLSIAVLLRERPVSEMVSQSVGTPLLSLTERDAEEKVTVESSRRRLSAQSSLTSKHRFLTDDCVDFLTLLPTHGDLSFSEMQSEPKSVYVIMPVHNPEKDLLIASIQSIVRNSPRSPLSLLTQVLILDDYSTVPVSDWTDWMQSLTESERRQVKFLRSSSARKGAVIAKNNAIRFLREKLVSKQGLSSASATDTTMIVIMDQPAIVSPSWLDPLALTLSKYHDAVVYPQIDILIAPSAADSTSSYSVMKAEDGLVAAMSWSFLPRWESAIDAKRIRSRDDGGSGMNNELISPSLPSTFATTLSVFDKFDLFDESLAPSGRYAQEHIDFATRVWLCGGVILKQTCSHIAQQYPNLVLDAVSAGEGVRQELIDNNVMNLAQRYLSLPLAYLESSDSDVHSTSTEKTSLEGVSLRELAFADRFTNSHSSQPRVAYSVRSSVDPVRTGPAQSALSLAEDNNGGVREVVVPIVPGKSGNHGLICLDFRWILQELYPGLQEDLANVRQRYRMWINTPAEASALTKSLSTLIALSYASTAAVLAQDSEDADKTRKRLSQREEMFHSQAARVLSMPAPLTDNSRKQVTKKIIHEPSVVHKQREPQLDDLIDIHRQEVRETLLCQDFRVPDKYLKTDKRHHGGKVQPESKLAAAVNYCSSITSGGDHGMCETMKVKMLFSCPKTCGYCDSEIDKFCEDFFLLKCRSWKEQGKCGTKDKEFGDISANCRKSCNVCTPDYAKPNYMPIGQRESIEADKDSNNHDVAVSRDARQKNQDEGSAAAVGITHLPIDPHALRREYLLGKIPDALSLAQHSQPCDSQRSDDGRLLSRVVLNTEWTLTPENLSDDQRAVLQSGLSIPEKGVRIFCGIYTMAKSHASNVQAVRWTWARKCDGFIAFSTATDVNFNAMEIKHEGDEAYDNMWQKSRSIWKFLYENLVDDFDYFLLGGDDMFYIVENLRAYLNSDEIENARKSRNGLYIGRIFQPPKQVVFNSGGAGYLLDAKALKVLGRNIDTPKCWPHQRGFWEDVNVATCLKASEEHIVPYDTRDAMGRERFHPFNPGAHLTYRIPPKNPDWYAKYNPELKVGFDCCSSESVSFHYLPAELLYKVHNYLYYCDAK